MEDRITPTAKTFYVGFDGDIAGPGSLTLRQAINDANANAGIDTIEFASDYFDTFHVINLTSDLPLLTESVTILGTTAQNCVIDGTHIGSGQAKFSMFHSEITGEGIEVVIDNLTFQNAKSSDNGGAIGLSAGTLTISNSFFFSCESGSSGGAIAMDSGTVTITGDFEPLATIEFNHNTSAVYGGAIYVGNGTLTLSDATLFYSTSTLRGGAIHVGTGTVVLEGLDVQDCKTEGNGIDSQYGGAVNLDYGSLTVTDCFFGTNTTSIESLTSGKRSYGGTINVGQGSTLIRTTRFNDDPHSTIISEGGADYGGCISVQTTTAPVSGLSFRTVIDYSVIKKGYATFSGGGIYVGSQAALGGNAKPHYFYAYDSIIAENVTSQTYTDPNTQVTTNYGIGGGIGIAGKVPTAIISDCNFSKNTALVSGGGISVTGSSLLVTDSTFILCKAVDEAVPSQTGDGGGIAATSALGATAEVLTLMNSTFSQNGATQDGGAIWSDRVSLAIANSTFDENFTVEGSGGAIAFRQSAKVGSEYLGSAGFQAINSTFSANAAADLGGAVVLRDLRSDADFEFVTMTLNTADANGGGIALQSVVGDSANIPMVNIDASVISGNTVGTGSEDVYNASGVSAFDFHYSLLGTYTATSGGTIFTLDATSKLLEGSDPLLGSLADNGGPTMTHAPLYETSTSPLIDKIPADAYTTTGDQRGFARGVTWPGTTTTDIDDIGAVELSSVSKLIVNDGAEQRSRLFKIEVHFLATVNVTALNALGAVTLTRTLTTAGPPGTVVQSGVTSGAVGKITVSAVSGNPNAIVLTFDNANAANVTTGVEYASLADGRWQLSIPSMNYISMHNGSNLRRLFGDSQNDGTVDGVDLITFGNAFNMESLAFDFNQDTVVDGTDLSYFGNRFGIVL